MEVYEITIVELNTREKLSVQVEVDEAELSQNISIFAKIKEQEITTKDYYYLPAYQKFRDKMLEAGYGIRCNGSRLNAVQSEMMGATDKVYLVEMGKQTQMKDVVHIWDYAEIDNFPDTKQQKFFLKQWINSHLSI